MISGKWSVQKGRQVVNAVSTCRSDYRKYLPGQSIKVRLKMEQNCRLFLDIFSSAITNDLSMTFTSRLKVDAKCVYQQWDWITVANYFGTPPVDWVHGYRSVFWAWRMDLNKEVSTLFAHCKKLIWKMFLKFNLGTCPWMAFAWNFFGIFLTFLRKVCGTNHL